MSAGNAGNQGSGQQDDDPFGYLYRPEGGSAPAAQPSQPSYNQVRPVGERTYGGKTAGYGYPPQRDPHYAAPETQPGGAGGRGGRPGGPAGPGGWGPDPDAAAQRRNRLLIGAIAGVTAVVLGVGAAVLFSGEDSGDGDGDDVAQVDPKPGEDDGDTDETPPEDDENDGEDDDGEDEDEDEDETPEGLPEADIAELVLDNGALLGGGHVDGARSADGSYIAGLDNDNATISWQFDFQGDPGRYRVYIGYSVPGGDQQMSFAVNTAVRNDKVNFRDYVDQGSWDKNWTRTYNEIDLEEGTNTIQIGCASSDSCEVIIDKMLITPNSDQPQW